MLIRDREVSFAPFQSPDFVVSWSPASEAAWDLAGSLRIAPAEDQSTILQLSMETEQPKLGVDVLNTLMHVYDSLIIEDKNRIATNSKEFIDKSLDTLRQLDGVESGL